MIFSDISRQIAANAYARALCLIDIANGAQQVCCNDEADSALIGAATAVGGLLALPCHNEPAHELVPVYLNQLYQRGLPADPDDLLAAAAMIWLQQRAGGDVQMLSTLVFARMLCHALGLAFDLGHCYFPPSALHADETPLAAIVTDGCGEEQPGTLLFNVYANRICIARVPSLTDAARRLAEARAVRGIAESVIGAAL